jgi:hypothetical protein
MPESCHSARLSSFTTPLFSEFKQLLGEYGCEYKLLECRLETTDVFYTVPYFERDMGGRLLRCAVFFEDDDRVEFSDIRRICRMLEVPTAIFGMDVTDWF